MGIDNIYRALPADDELVRFAQEDKDVATDALFPVILFEYPAASDQWVRSYPRYQLVRDLVARYPDIRRWHHEAGRWDPRRLASILYYGPAGEDLAKHHEPGFETSLALKATQANRVFNDQFKSSTGFPIRYSEPAVVQEIAEFCRGVDIEALPAQWDREIFVELSAFYQRIASQGNLAVFFMRN